MTPRPLLLLFVAASCVLAGCRDDAGTGAAPAAVDAPRAAIVMPGPVDPSDAAAYAGSFVARGVLLQIRPDGRYLLRVHAESAAADLESEGLWSLETGSGQLLLVPHAADEPRRRYSLPSHDELVPEGGGLPLRRTGRAEAG